MIKPVGSSVLDLRAEFVVETRMNRLLFLALRDTWGPLGPDVASALTFATGAPVELPPRARGSARKARRLALSIETFASKNGAFGLVALRNAGGGWEPPHKGPYRIHFLDPEWPEKVKWTALCFDLAGHAFRCARIDRYQVARECLRHLRRDFECALDGAENGEQLSIFRPNSPLERKRGVRYLPETTIFVGGELLTATEPRS